MILASLCLDFCQNRMCLRIPCTVHVVELPLNFLGTPKSFPYTSIVYCHSTTIECLAVVSCIYSSPPPPSFTVIQCPIGMKQFFFAVKCKRCCFLIIMVFCGWLNSSPNVDSKKFTAHTHVHVLDSLYSQIQYMLTVYYNHILGRDRIRCLKYSVTTVHTCIYTLIITVKQIQQRYFGGEGEVRVHVFVRDVVYMYWCMFVWVITLYL